VAIRFESRTVDGVPLLLAFPDSNGAPWPTVFWFHGFGVDSEVHRPELRRIAEAGFLAVGVDAAGHGRRRLPDLQERIDQPHEQALRTMTRLAAQTAAEIPGLVRALADEGIADPDRVALVGVSMGGYLVYRALLEPVALRAAVSILGSPEWPEGDSPHQHLDAFCRTALLSITGERDENVPPDGARALHRRLDEQNPRSVHRYVEIPGAPHLMDGDQWAVVMDEMPRWLERYVLRPAHTTPSE
jgi:hypothetical protein